MQRMKILSGFCVKQLNISSCNLFLFVASDTYDAVMAAYSSLSVSGRKTVYIHIHNVLASIKQHVKHLVCERSGKQSISLCFVFLTEANRINIK